MLYLVLALVECIYSLKVGIDCTDASFMALAVRYNNEQSGFLYGTNAFAAQNTDINLSHYAYSGGACICSFKENKPASEGKSCEDG